MSDERHDAEIRTTAIQEAAVEIAHLRRVIADIKDFTRYTANPRWALARITVVIAKRV